MSYTVNLDGARVLIVGGSSGIGKATAALFVRAGAQVLVAARAGERLERAAAEISAEAIALDTRDNDAIEAFFASQAPFEHVVISAAQTKAGSVAGLSLEDARAAMDSKFWGAYQIARAVKVTPTGSLTFVSGLLAHRPNPASVLQGALNAALEALGRGLALEYAPVRVNTVSPGVIETPLWSAMPEAQRQAVFSMTAGRLPVRRIGQPEDVASAIFTLATNRFVTGATLAVDGGGSIA